MSPQEIFDTVAAHLFTQGRQAVSRDGTCQYRTEDGLKCAVGCLIRDEDYNPEIEDLPAFNTRVLDRLPFKVDVEVEVEVDGPEFSVCSLLQSLQRVHDHEPDWASTHAMRTALAYVAERYHLKFIPENYQFSDR